MFEGELWVFVSAYGPGSERDETKSEEKIRWWLETLCSKEMDETI